MKNYQRLSIIIIAIAVLFGCLGFSTQPASAATCSQYHTVRRGQSLSWIGAWYGVNWKALADANGIKAPWVIYPGQRLCITGKASTGWSTPTKAASWKNWNFAVIGVVEDTTVTIQTALFPDNMLYTAEIGCPSCGVATVAVADVDSDKGGVIKKVFDIPEAFAGVNRLWVRLTQVNNSDYRQVAFNNSTVYYPGGLVQPQPGKSKWIPTISIVSVVRNNSVTFRTYNYPAGRTFDVLMGPMGTRGVHGYFVGSFNSGDGGSMTVTFNIPPEMYGARQIAIRSQSRTGGYFSYNWFYNNTAN